MCNLYYLIYFCLSFLSHRGKALLCGPRVVGADTPYATYCLPGLSMMDPSLACASNPGLQGLNGCRIPADPPNLVDPSLADLPPDEPSDVLGSIHKILRFLSSNGRVCVGGGVYLVGG
jgi:hypothetical protein